jgi:hypothetical protein
MDKEGKSQKTRLDEATLMDLKMRRPKLYTDGLFLLLRKTRTQILSEADKRSYHHSRTSDSRIVR